ncbi:hypothetical protein NQ318_005410 [Aromia moschata]|uniref:RZZ complex subunit KNTC1/ROD C-terminal domain-containing protein n=1 Tax=Aromia moschata TaxID=1265417 RepID=A0AAV8YYQ4_9CUCU|nr:hypothetical protein NQ318_005410 [Aromia moschata]
MSVDSEAGGMVHDSRVDPFQANFYHYEVFICVLKILSENGRASDERTHDMSTLLFLKNYSRCSAPSQSEEEQWYGSFPDTQALDPLGVQVALRAHPLHRRHLEHHPPGDQPEDIQVLVRRHQQPEEEPQEGRHLHIRNGWILYPKFEDLFAEVDECVQHISDLEKATSVVYHLMYHTANGADKVNAAQLSYKYAKKYKDNNPNSSEIDKAYTKVKVKYYSFSAMHILHMYQVADEKYLQLVVQPRDLIDALYSDGRIISQAESVNLDCPDINKAVDALGALFNLDVNDIRYSLVTRWLNSSSADVDFDSSVMFPSATKASSGADDNLKRAMYVCSSGNKAFWQSYLLKVGMDEHDAESSTWKSMAFKARGR